MSIRIISEHKCFQGKQSIYKHFSTILNCEMRFGIFLPPQMQARNLPVLYWLSGLTCTQENFITKAGAQRTASELGIVLVVPDTSPRGVNIPGEEASDDFGSGASFYVDATEAPWAVHYKMYSYITKELPDLIANHYPIDPMRVGIFGHSMGGHGALTIALKNPGIYKSVSAFAPICSVIKSPWGRKALSGYLGDDEKKWQDYDAAKLVQLHGWQGPEILIDQGTADPYLTEQLQPQWIEEACKEKNVPLNLRMQDGYDHSYYFISTFIADHLRLHAKNLNF